jgi:hypothetical protein
VKARIRRRWKVIFPVLLAGILISSTRGEDAPPLWLSSASRANEILVFSEIHRSRDGRGYVMVSEARRVGSRTVVRAAAGDLLRADYDLIVPIRFGFHLGAHVFINQRGEPLLAVDTSVNPPALAVSRPYREDDRIYLGTTRNTRETISVEYYRDLADSLERVAPELAAIARRSLKLPPQSRLKDGFPLSAESR